MFRKSVIVSILMFGAYLSPANALVLEKLVQRGSLERTLTKKVVGVFLGTFDPVHKGHERAAALAIEQDICDYVLIYPHWAKGKAKAALKDRLEMLFAAFADHPTVIVTRLSPYEMQAVLTLNDDGHLINGKATVVPAFGGTEFVGIMGSDTALSVNENDDAHATYMSGLQIPPKFQRHTVGGSMSLPVNHFVVVQRQGDDLDILDDHIGERRIQAVLESDEGQGLSSTDVRQAIKSGQAIGSMVNPAVAKIIVSKKLYR